MGNKKSIEDILTQLNAEQRQAVEHIYGPLMVVAGPGTGKTQLLSARVANLLSVTDTAAQNILCLTFTDKAAGNMRERLVGMVGAPGRDVAVHTFHGLAGLIINDYSDFFWRGAAFNPISEVAYARLIEDILAKLPLDNYFANKYQDIFTKRRDAADLISRAKKSGLNANKLKALAEANIEYLNLAASHLSPAFVQHAKPRLSIKTIDKLNEAVESLPTLDINIAPIRNIEKSLKQSWGTAYKKALSDNKTTAVGKWITAQLKNSTTKDFDFWPEIKRNKQIIDLCVVYSQVRDEMQKRRHYDFDDMIIQAIEAVEQNETLRSELRERFHFLLIDEFQDTNAAQLRLAGLIASGENNLMVVGDDDQAIYKFQGAELNNLINFREDNRGAETITLNKNYRSNQNIIDQATAVINTAELRLVNKYDDIDKDIQAAVEHTPGSIVYDQVESQQDEYYALADDILSYRRNRPDASIAVIARKHDPLVQAADKLLQADLPIIYERQSNVFEQPVVATFIEVLSIIDAIETGAPGQLNYLLQQSLRRPSWGISPDDLWSLAVNEDYRRMDWLSRLKDIDATKPVAQWIENMVAVFANENAVYSVETLLGLGQKDDDDHNDDYQGPLAAYCRENKITHEYLVGLSGIALIRDMANDAAQSNGQPAMPARQLLDFCHDYLKTNLQLSNTTRFSADENPIELLTAHKAKGLEFDAVFIVGATESSWSKSGGRDMKPPSNLPLHKASDDQDDFIRLMFVALTRAVSDIHIYCHKFGAGVKQQLPATSLTTAGLQPEERTVSTEQAAQASIDRLLWPRLAQATERELLADRIETFKLSATTLTNFLDLRYGGPQYFFERNILRLPDVKKSSAAIGSAMHAVLEHELNEINSQRQPDNAQRAEVFGRALEREHLPAAEFERLLEQGRKRIVNLFDDLGYQLPQGSQAETEIPAVLKSGNLLSGKLDRIDPGDNDHIAVIDYKTGKPVTNLKSRAQDAGIKAWQYRLQMTFYALLARNNPRFKSKRVESTFVYVFADHKEQLQASFTPSDEDIDNLEAIVDAVYSRIKDLNFEQPDSTGTEDVKLNDIEQFIASL